MSKIVCAYIRVSTDSQEEYSPDAQIRLLKEYAEKNNMILTDIYQDLGISGRKAEKRPEFQNMIAMAKSKEHPYDAILVWKFSRFARNQEESIVYKSLLKKNKVDVVSVSEPLPDGVIGELVERIFEWMDEYYSIRLSGEVKRGMTQKALSGGYNGQPPIGYVKEKGSNTIPYPDPYYADMVRKVFHMWTEEQRSLISIAASINEKGYRTRRGNKWESRNIADMIQNPFYIGKIRWNYTENRARNLTSETIIVDGKHESLISAEQFEAANIRYQQMSASRSHKKRETIYRHWLSGMMKCPTCGGTLAYQSGKDHKTGKQFPYFVCYKSVKGMCTTRNSISVSKAESAVIAGLKDISENASVYHLEPVKPYQSDAAAVKLQIAQLESRLNRARDAYLAGIDSLNEYKANKSTLETEIAKLMAFDYDVPAPEPITKEKVKSVYEFIESSDIMSEKAYAISSIIDHIVYDKSSDSMEFYLKYQ